MGPSIEDIQDRIREAELQRQEETGETEDEYHRRLRRNALMGLVGAAGLGAGALSLRGARLRGARRLAQRVRSATPKNTEEYDRLGRSMDKYQKTVDDIYGKHFKGTEPPSVYSMMEDQMKPDPGSVLRFINRQNRQKEMELRRQLQRRGLLPLPKNPGPNSN